MTRLVPGLVSHVTRLVPGLVSHVTRLVPGLVSHVLPRGVVAGAAAVCRGEVPGGQERSAAVTRMAGRRQGRSR